MNTPDFSGLKTMYVNCTLKRSPEKSHTQGLMDVSAHIMKKENVQVDTMAKLLRAPATSMRNQMHTRMISLTVMLLL